MELTEIKALSDADMLAVNQLIQQKLTSDVALINQLGMYIINSGGKRLRPLLTVLTARALECQNNKHITLAAIIEFIHTATLLHDDVVDESLLRRGKETANALFGNEASVLVGDFLYTRSFQMMVSLNDMQVMNILSDATNRIAQGEVMQLMNCNNADITEAAYFDVIYSKTARLFEAATHLAAVVNGKDERVQTALATYGRELGNAFQLVDDALDYVAESDVIGKNAGDDLAEGKPTLPIIHAMAVGDNAIKTRLRQAIEHPEMEADLQLIRTDLEKTGSITYTMQRAQQHATTAKQALEGLAKNRYVDALGALADYAVARIS